MNSTIVDTEVNAFQDDMDANTWTVQVLHWYEGQYVADRKVIKSGVKYDELEYWFTIARLQQ